MAGLQTCEQELLHFIRVRTGIVLHPHQQRDLYRTVQEACQRFGFRDCSDFVAALTELGPTSPEMEFLVAGITVGESYFFRDPVQIDFLRQHWIPQLLRKRRSGERSLRIWSAGCSHGQELYTIAMLLAEQLPDIEAWNLHLLGTDINTQVLSKAIAGEFGEWSFRATPAHVRARFFTQHEEQWRISERLRRAVTFSYVNLKEDSYPAMFSDTNQLDLILCRNVFIYFDRSTVASILERFHRCLSDDGILIVGASDLVDTQIKGFQLHQESGAFYYSKAQHAETPARPAPVSRERPKPALRTTHARTPRKRDEDNRLQPAPRTASVGSDEKLMAALQAQDWEQVSRLTESELRATPDNADLWVKNANACANLGRMDLAEKACQHAIGLNPTDKHAHFVHGLVRQESGDSAGAERALRKALYLDPFMLEAHCQLAALLLRSGRGEHGLKSLRNALEVAEREQADRELQDAPGMTYGRMAEVLRQQIAMHS